MTRISSILMGPGSAFWHGSIARCRARYLRRSTPLLSSSASNSKGFRALHLSRKSAPYSQWLRRPHRRIIFWTLLTGAGISYSIYNAQPLVLESDEAFETLGLRFKQKYSSLTNRLTIEQANEVLRRIENSEIIGVGSGILRLDTMQLPSNPIPEDICLTAGGQEDGETRWMLCGIYDGHA